MAAQRGRLGAFASGPGPTRAGVVLVVVSVVALIASAVLLALPAGPPQCPPCNTGNCPTSCAEPAHPWVGTALGVVALCFLAGLTIAVAGAVYRARCPTEMP